MTLLNSQAKPAARSLAGTLFHLWMLLLTLLLSTFVIIISTFGWDYYRSPLTARFRSPLHSTLKPGGEAGHMLGIVGAGMLVGLLVYSVRKRSSRLRDWGKLSSWLNFHIFLGIAGPILITYHTAFKLRGIVAISYWSMVLVVISGMLGRYLYAQVNSAMTDSELQDNELDKQVESINVRLAVAQLDPALLARLNEIASFRASSSASALRAPLVMLGNDLLWLFRRRKLRRMLAGVPGLDAPHRVELVQLARQRQLSLRKTALLRSSQKLFRYWHIIHLPLAQTMYITMVIHIVVAVMTGYF